MVQKLAQFTDIRAALVVGGLSLQAQAATLREQPEIVVATPVSLPGRMGSGARPGRLRPETVPGRPGYEAWAQSLAAVLGRGDRPRKHQGIRHQSGREQGEGCGRRAYFPGCLLHLFCIHHVCSCEMEVTGAACLWGGEVCHPLGSLTHVQAPPCLPAILRRRAA